MKAILSAVLRGYMSSNELSTVVDGVDKVSEWDLGELGLSRHSVLLSSKEEIRLPGWLSSRESTCNLGASGEMGSTPGSGISPGGGHGCPLKYSCWRIPWTEELGGL